MSLKMTRCLFQSEKMTILACLLFFQVLKFGYVVDVLYLSRFTLSALIFFWYRKEKHKHCLSINGFLTEKEANKTWKVYTDGIWTLNLSRDDPACIALRYLCITFKSLKVFIFCLRAGGPSLSLTPYIYTSVLTGKRKLPCRFWLQHWENMYKYM